MRRFALFTLAAAIVIAAGCTIIDPGPTDYVIKADSIVGPSAVSGNAALNQQVYAYVGPTGCYHFREFRVARTPGVAEVTLVGERTDGLCTQALVFMNETLAISPPMTNPFVIVIRQPDGTQLRKTISIE